MNRKYIDFVPSSKVGAGARRVASPRRRVVSEVREEGVTVTMPDGASVSRTRVFRTVGTRGDRTATRDEERFETYGDGVEISDGGVRFDNDEYYETDIREKGAGTRGLSGSIGNDWAYRASSREGDNRNDGADERLEYEDSRLEADEVNVWSGREDVWDDRVIGTESVAKPEYRERGYSEGAIPRLGVVEDYNPKFVSTNVSKRPLGDEPTNHEMTSGVGGTDAGQNEISAIKAKKVKRGVFGRNKKAGNVATEAKMTAELTKIGAAKTGVAGATGTLSAAGSAVVSSTRRKNVSTKRETSAKPSVTRAASQDVEFARKLHDGEKSNSKFVPPRTPFINQEKIVKRPLSSKNVYQKAVQPSKEEAKGPVTIISNTEKDSKMGLVVTIILTIILGAAAGTVAFLLLPK